MHSSFHVSKELSVLKETNLRLEETGTKILSLIAKRVSISLFEMRKSLIPRFFGMVKIILLKYAAEIRAG